MQAVQYVIVTENELGQRLDNFLIRVLKGVPKSYIYRIIREGQVRINKKRARPDARLNTDDCIRIPPVRVAQPMTVKLDSQLGQYLQDCILFENDAFLVINKPAGVAVHGGSGISFGVIELLRHRRTDLTYLELVHRLDRETSGCLLLAKKRSILRELQAQFESRTVKKIYWALLYHRWEGAEKRYVDRPLLKNTLSSGERVVRIDEQGKSSKTRFILLANAADYCLVEASPKTGRTHQIRVHSAYLGHPVVGDEKYALQSNQGATSLPGRLYLHARSIQFKLNQQPYEFVAELDKLFLSALDILKMDMRSLIREK